MSDGSVYPSMTPRYGHPKEVKDLPTLPDAPKENATSPHDRPELCAAPGLDVGGHDFEQQYFNRPSMPTPQSPVATFANIESGTGS